MWLLTKTGFYSIVKKPDEEQLCIRTRQKKDLLDLKRHYLPSMSEPVHCSGADYAWRAWADPAAVAEAFAAAIRDIGYPNFKDEVKHRQGTERARTYSRVWSELLVLQEEPEAGKPKSRKQQKSFREDRFTWKEGDIEFLIPPPGLKKGRK